MDSVGLDKQQKQLLMDQYCLTEQELLIASREATSFDQILDNLDADPYFYSLDRNESRKKLEDKFNKNTNSGVQESQKPAAEKSDGGRSNNQGQTTRNEGYAKNYGHNYGNNYGNNRGDDNRSRGRASDFGGRKGRAPRINYDVSYPDELRHITCTFRHFGNFK